MFPIQYSVTKKDDRLPDHLRTADVKSLTFNLHLPFRLRVDSPVPSPVPWNGRTFTLTFEEAESITEYSDGFRLTFPYTIARVEVCWESAGPKLIDLLQNPLAAELEIPLLILNALIESYQSRANDYRVRKLISFDIPYTPGLIHLQNPTETLSFVSDNSKSRDGQIRDIPDPELLLVDALRLLESNGFVLAWRAMNNAKKQYSLYDFHLTVIECTTCIECLSDAAVAHSLRASGTSDADIERALGRGLTAVLRQVVPSELPILNGGTYTSLCDEWLTQAYRLRNRIVHEGHKQVSAHEAQRCLAKTGELAQALEDAVGRILPQ